MSALRSVARNQISAICSRFLSQPINVLKADINPTSFPQSTYNGLSCLACRNINTGQSSGKMKGKGKDDEDDEEIDAPVKFTTSKAAKWRAEHTWRGTDDDEMPRAQPIIVSLSLAVFMVYFFYLREENDLDQRIDSDLYMNKPRTGN